MPLNFMYREFWEAGVQSKHHLQRIVGNAHLTFEVYNTILTQIKTVLNFRRFSTLSPDVRMYMTCCRTALRTCLSTLWSAAL